MNAVHGLTSGLSLLLWPTIFLACGFFLGWLAERLFLGQLRRFAQKTNWEGDDILLEGFAWLPRIWGLLIGLHLTLNDLPLNNRTNDLLHKILLALIILSATLFASRILVGFVRLYTRAVEGVVPATSIFYSLTRAGTWILGVLIALQSVGISIAPLLTALGVGGLATALALQPTLSNLFSGIQILASRSINVGDYVRVEGGEEGFVHDINWRVATLRTMQNNLVLIPNGKLANAVVTNHQFPESELTLSVNLGVAYGTDLAHLESVLLGVAREVQTELEGAVTEHEPVYRITSLGDSAILLQVVLRAKSMEDIGLVRHEYLRRVLPALAAAKIEIPYPHRVIVAPEKAS